MARKLYALLGSVSLSVLLAACGGDSGGGMSAPTSNPPPPTDPPPAQTGTLEVRVTDPDGNPVPYAQVNVNAPADSGTWTSSYSDGLGIAVFSSLPIGSVSAFASGWPSHYSSDQVEVQIATGTRTNLSLTIAPVYAGTAIVLATRHISSVPDGSEIEFEADIAVVDPSGQPITGLDASHVTLPPSDCGDWDPLCIVDDAGQEAGRWTPVTGAPSAFEWRPGSTESVYAAGLLVDQGTYIGLERWDPGRKTAIVEFLDSFDPANSVALAEFSQPLGQTFAVRYLSHFVGDYNGRFVSEFAALRNAALSIDRRVGGSSPVDLAVPEMLGTMDWWAPPQARELVLVAPGGPAWDNQWVQTVVDASEFWGTPVNLIGQGGPAAVAAVARSGGALFIARFPAQMRTAFRSLDAVLSGSMPFYRMRFRLQMTETAAVDQPRTLRASVGIALPARDDLWVPVSVRLGPAVPAP